MANQNPHARLPQTITAYSDRSRHITLIDKEWDYITVELNYFNIIRLSQRFLGSERVARSSPILPIYSHGVSLTPERNLIKIPFRQFHHLSFSTEDEEYESIYPIIN